MILGFSIFALTTIGCFSSYVSAPRDIAYVSKQISIKENRIPSSNSKVIPNNVTEVYQAAEHILKDYGEVIVPFAKNNLTQQYHHQQFMYWIKPPYNNQGAIVSSNTGISKTRDDLNLTIVYIHPLNTQEVELSVAGINSERAPSFILNEILFYLGNTPASKPSNNNETTNIEINIINNNAQESAQKALDNLDKSLSEEE